MSDYTKEDIDNVAKALRQVVSVNPQLLFKALQQTYADLMIDIMKEDVAEKPNHKRRDAYAFRASVCLWLSRVLLQSGRAALDDDDVAALTLFTTFRGK